MNKPLLWQFAPFYNGYVQRTIDCNSIDELVEKHHSATIDYYNNLPDSLADFAYAEGKWTIKQVLQHIIDTDRIFGYRLLRIIRGDKTVLPGFDENFFANATLNSNRSINSLKKEFLVVREANLFLVQSVTEEQLYNYTTMSGSPITANALIYIIYGHLLHHQQVLNERYLSKY
ncbi:MAG: DinB family protein [Chitinophagaceae bacterium]